MTKKAKKGIIITISVIVALFLILLIAPFVFKGQIMEVVKKEVNKTMNAKVEFDDVGLSFIRNFPNASVRINNLRITGTGDFEVDTLVATKNIRAVINLKSLFGNSGYEIKLISADDASVYAHILPDGRPNWDIMKVDSSQLAADTEEMNFKMKLQKVELNNAKISYFDEEGQMKADLDGVNFTTSGDFSADSSLLKSRLTVKSLTFEMEKIEYLSKADIDIKADINANLNKMIFAFSDNSSRINAIEFVMNGWVQMLEPEGFDMDLSIDAQKVDFKSILSMIPAIYNNQFQGLKAEGEVGLNAHLKGKMREEIYPAFAVGLTINNGWFQYPDLPKSLKDVNVDLKINSPTEQLDAMTIDLSKLSFNMDGNVFQAKAHVSQPMTDPDVTAFAKGKIDLGAVKNLYPLEAGTDLNGIFNLDLDLATRMSYFENNQFEKIKFSGNMDISNLLLKMSEMPNDISVSSAKMEFNNRFVDLSRLDMKIGRNDISANGKLENFIPYVLDNKTLKGQLDLSSNYLNISDFMSGEAAQTEKAEQPLSVIELPKNIDFTMQANIKELVYEKMNFTNAKGALKLSDGTLTFQNMGLQGFGGTLTANGSYNALNPEKPEMKMDLDLANVAFTKVFEQIDFVKKFAPIFDGATGTFSTKLNLDTKLGKDMMPDLMSLIADGNISTNSVQFKEIPALTALAQNLNKPEIANTAIKNLSLLFAIKAGRVETKPFDVNLAGVNLNIGGSTGLDQSLSYKGTAKLPENLKLGKLSSIGFEIGGTFSKPTINLDIKNTLNSLLGDTKQQVQDEVDKKVDEAKQKVNDELAKQKENAVKEAQIQADKLRNEAKKAGEKLVEEATAQSKKLVDATSNPIAKTAASAAGKKLVDEAQKQADKLYNEADKQGKELVNKAENL